MGILAAFVLVTSYIFVYYSHAKNSWRSGFFNRQMMPDDLCPVPDQVPFAAMFPNGMGNFYVPGAFSCSSTYRFATIEDNILTIDWYLFPSNG